MTEPDITANFTGGPNDGKSIPLHGSPTRYIDIPTGGLEPPYGNHRYELDMIVWAEKGIAQYSYVRYEDPEEVKDRYNRDLPHPFEGSGPYVDCKLCGRAYGDRVHNVPEQPA